MICHFGDNCKFDHTKFDNWKGNDKTLQLEFVKQNPGKVVFNVKTVKSLPPGNESLLRAPGSDGEGSA